MTLSVRHRSSQKAEYISEMLDIKSLGKKCYVIAIHYKKYRNFRDLVCNDLTWQVKDFMRGYSLRWLHEVIFVDWKQYDGWGKGALPAWRRWNL